MLSAFTMIGRSTIHPKKITEEKIPSSDDFFASLISNNCDIVCFAFTLMLHIVTPPLGAVDLFPSRKNCYVH
jgi:hypothetical protein